jgi:predicted kinase
MKELVLLVANTGEGKSTLAKKYQEKGYVVIGKDSIRYAIGAGNYVYKQEYEPIIWEIELSMLESFMDLGVDIVIDSICVSKIMRARYINPAKLYDYKVKCHLLPQLTMKEAVDRRMQNPHGQNDRALWEHTWVKFQQQYEEPTLDEGIDEIIRDI